MGWLRRLYDWVLSWAETRYGTAALGAIAFAESSFFPVPPDVLLIALALGKPRRAWWFAGVCSLGSVVGGAFGYLIGRWLKLLALAAHFAEFETVRLGNVAPSLTGRPGSQHVGERIHRAALE